MKKYIRKYLLSILIIFSFYTSALYVNAATGIPFFRVGEGINTLAFVANKVMVVAHEYIDQIREGNIPDHTYVHIRGHSHSVGTADQELSALGTAGFGNWPSAAAGVVLVSTDVDDVTAGTGAWKVTVRGLDDVDGEWVAAETTVTMTGTTPTAASAQEFIRIDELEVDTAGTSYTNEGDITASIGGTNIMVIYAEHSTSDGGRKTVASDMEMYLNNPEASAIGNKEMTYHIFCRDNTISDAAFQLRASWHSKDGGYRPNGKIEVFGEKVDLVFIAHSEIAGAKASGSIEGWMETVD